MERRQALLSTQVAGDHSLARPYELERGLSARKLFFAQGTFPRIAKRHKAERVPPWMVAPFLLQHLSTVLNVLPFFCVIPTSSVQLLPPTSDA
jgi:hypothetical protein